MSNYPIWWNTTITVYNKFIDPITQVVTWYKRSINRCFWQYVKDNMTVGDTVLETNRTICRIREDDFFKEKHLWIGLPADQKENFYTLSQGDIIVKGKVDDEIDEYSSGHRSSDLIGKYKELQGCFEIDAVAINVGTGRGLPHYKAQGV